MKTRKALAATLLAALALIMTAHAALRAEVIEQVLVKVNGQIYTKSDLEARQVLALREMGQQVDPKTKTIADDKLRPMLDQITPTVIVGAVDEMLLLQRGKDLGYTLSDEQFKSVTDSIKKDNNWTTDEQLTQALAAQEGMTLADFRKNVERSVIMDRVKQTEVLSKIGISDEEARAYYDAHQAEFTAPEEVTLRELLVAVPTTAGSVNAAADQAAREKIDGLRVRAVNGESFEKLAADFSDSPSAKNAGLVGPLKTSDISDELRKILAQMKPGDITTPLRAPTGYQLLKLESRSDTKIMPFDQAKDQINDKVFNSKRQDEYEKYMDKLRSQAIIDWKNPDLKKAYELGLAQQKAGTAPTIAAAPPAAR
jgi:parvulin-like peptidyl-prolyl isomerase